jgi:cobalamin biosynthesis protein CbiD
MYSQRGGTSGTALTAAAAATAAAAMLMVQLPSSWVCLTHVSEVIQLNRQLPALPVRNLLLQEKTA